MSNYAVNALLYGGANDANYAGYIDYANLSNYAIYVLLYGDVNYANYAGYKNYALHCLVSQFGSMAADVRPLASVWAGL